MDKVWIRPRPHGAGNALLRVNCALTPGLLPSPHARHRDHRLRAAPAAEHMVARRPALKQYNLSRNPPPRMCVKMRRCGQKPRLARNPLWDSLIPWPKLSRSFAPRPAPVRSALHSGCVGGDVIELQRERDRRIHPHQDGDVRDPIMTEDLDPAVVEALGGLTAG